jgi:hypothetical protein
MDRRLPCAGIQILIEAAVGHAVIEGGGRRQDSLVDFWYHTTKKWDVDRAQIRNAT